MPKDADRFAVIERFFQKLSEGRIEESMEVFTEDVSMRVPFQPKGERFWSETIGKTKLLKFLGSLPKLFDAHTIVVDEHLPVAGADQVVARYHGNFIVSSTKKPYDNTYIAVFTFDGELISSWVEYHNPLVLLEAFEP